MLKQIEFQKFFNFIIINKIFHKFHYIIINNNIILLEYLCKLIINNYPQINKKIIFYIDKYTNWEEIICYCCYKNLFFDNFILILSCLNNVFDYIFFNKLSLLTKYLKNQNIILLVKILVNNYNQLTIYQKIKTILTQDIHHRYLLIYEPVKNQPIQTKTIINFINDNIKLLALSNKQKLNLLTLLSNNYNNNLLELHQFLKIFKLIYSSFINLNKLINNLQKYTVNDLIEALLATNLPRALSIIQYFQYTNHNIPNIIIGLNNFLLNLLMIKTNLCRPYGYYLKFIDYANNISLQKLNYMIILLNNIQLLFYKFKLNLIWLKLEQIIIYLIEL